MIEVTALVFEIFFESSRSRSSMLKKSMLPPTLSWLVRSSRTPRSWKRRASWRWTIVAPTWRLDVVADDRQPGLLEALVPVVLAGDEDRQAVDEADAGRERLLDVPLGRVLGADRQVTDEDVGLGLFEDADDVGGFARGFGDLLFQVLAEAVVGHAALDLDAEVRARRRT